VRIVVVGASTGLGRCIGIGLAKRGDQLALLARRKDLLDEAAEEAGPGTLAITCDVTDEASCRAAVAEAVRGLGGIDAVVHSAGIGVLRRIEEIDAATWHRTFDTNVVGASIFTAAALPALLESHGIVAYLSSVSASWTPPWPGLGSYTVTKAALDKLVAAWRAEHPLVGFSQVVVGDCAGGDGPATSHLTDSWDMDLAGEFFPIWSTKGLLSESLVDVDDMVGVIDSVLRCGASACIPTITITPRPKE
jgi:NAD(P)-dependent dehydrogenase (short-subunit alcohol dehydrogenase family)